MKGTPLVVRHRRQVPPVRPSQFADTLQACDGHRLHGPCRDSTLASTDQSTVLAPPRLARSPLASSILLANCSIFATIRRCSDSGGRGISQKKKELFLVPVSGKRRAARTVYFHPSKRAS